jgi:hypothetical protein
VTRCVAAGVATALAVAGAAAGSSSRATACAATVQWHGTTYFGSRTLRDLPIGFALRGGVVPGCNDTPGANAPDMPTALRSIPRVALRTAVAVSGDRRTLYLAPGYFPQLPDFPLHAWLFRRRAAPVERPATCDTRTRVRVTGTVESAILGFLVLRVRAHELAVFVDAHTRIPHARGRLPYARRGATARVRGVECRRGRHFRKLVANRVEL